MDQVNSDYPVGCYSFHHSEFRVGWEADVVLAFKRSVEGEDIVHVDSDDNFPCFVYQNTRFKVSVSESYSD